MVTLLREPKRVVRTPAVDSRRWNDFEPREDDIVIATYAKCGTTWTQRIVDLLVFQSPAVRPFGDMSRWLDSTLFNSVEDDLATLRAQTHRRYIKSHLPFDALPVWDSVKYIHVGRDGRDARLSWQNHEKGFKPEFSAHIGALAAALAAEHGRRPDGPPPRAPEDPRTYLLHWFEEMETQLNEPDKPNAGRFGSEFFSFEDTYWQERNRENLLLVHYNDLKEDLAGEMRRIAEFLGIAVADSVMPSLVEAARFETMKKDGDALYPSLQKVFDRGADRFINQGRSGRWRDCLKEADIARYEALARRGCTPGLADWLEGGRRGAGDPKLSPD
ncbi:MAG TPA: sulfotransferase domain-containing protein [Rhizomicrobium sp.]|nr:sulfotransferase domain-containing protein [Rhizomicrobium sp.]